MGGYGDDCWSMVGAGRRGDGFDIVGLFCCGFLGRVIVVGAKGFYESQEMSWKDYQP